MAKTAKKAARQIATKAAPEFTKVPRWWEKLLRLKAWSDRHLPPILVKGLILIIAAVALVWIVQWHYLDHDVVAVWEFFAKKRLVVVSALVIFLIEGIIYGLVRRPWTTVGITAALVFLIDFINAQKMLYRGSPLYPEDFLLTDQAGTLASFIDFGAIVRLALAMILVVALGVLLDYLLPKWLKYTSQNKSSGRLKSYRLMSRIALIAVFGCGLSTTVAYFISLQSRREGQYIHVEEFHSDFNLWNQEENYAKNGFIVGFLSNLATGAVVEPSGYTEENTKAIMAKYEAEKAADTDRRSLENAGYNIIVILNESFYDPAILSDYYSWTGGDVTPVWHALQRSDRVLTGQTYSTEYGGGTAIVEYSAITGFSNFWTKVSSPYHSLVSKKASVPSLALFAKTLAGYNTVGIHAYDGTMYKRDVAYPIMGFDSFIEADDFSHTETYGESGYIDDASTYAEVLDVLTGSTAPLLMNVVTMQNHTPYDINEYGEPTFRLTSEAINPNEIETYLMTLHESDRALGEFLENLENLDEPTVVIWYGDHSAWMWSEVYESNSFETKQLVQLTPYFVYANFDLAENWPEAADLSEALELANISINLDAFKWEMTTGETETVENSELPTTTSNCLANTAFNVLNLEKPALFYLLDDVCAEAPILSNTYGAPVMTTTLSEYELLIYDLVVGQQYSLK